MHFTNLLAVAITTLPFTALAQTPTATEATPSQTTAFENAVRSYIGSLVDSPAATSLGLNLLINGNGDVIQSITQDIAQFIPTTSLDLYSLATDPPLTHPTFAWETQVGSNLRDDILSLYTSAALHIASLDQSVLGISASISTPTATPTDNQGAVSRQTAAAGLIGFAGVAAGAAAVLL